MSRTSFTEPETRTSLLRGVSDPRNNRAWEEFVDRYNPAIRRWCREWFSHDADEMSHEVMVKLVFVMKAYTYRPEKGRFRCWLKTVTRNVMVDLIRRSKRFIADSTVLDRELARIDLNERLAAEFDLELLEDAKRTVRSRVEPRTWSVYVETAEQLRRPADVAKEFGMRVGAVYRAKCVVMSALKVEVRSMAGS